MGENVGLVGFLQMLWEVGVEGLGFVRIFVYDIYVMRCESLWNDMTYAHGGAHISRQRGSANFKNR